MSNRILLVRVPDLEAADGRDLRDYILESLAQGVLVLTEDAVCEVMQLPPLGDVVVPAKQRELQEEQTEKAPDSAPDLLAVEAAEKRAILQRLTDYRTAHGRGCLASVAKATRTRGRINDNTLRMLLTGDTQLPIADWRKIGKALDMLEARGQADG